MTDLSTTNLQRLLDEATPGPWVTVGECFIDKDGNERYSPELISSRADGIGRDVMWNTDEAVSWCSNLHDPQLAALAPELAKEVLRLRKALDELYSAVVRTAEDCAIRDDHEGKLAARVAQSVSEQLFRILLEEDHDD